MKMIVSIAANTKFGLKFQAKAHVEPPLARRGLVLINAIFVPDGPAKSNYRKLPLRIAEFCDEQPSRSTSPVSHLIFG
jgi:hypothetical protein